MNIPIYRAKKIDGEEYVEGFYIDGHIVNIDYEGFETYEKIDESTLSIHFEGMLDSEGAKIFASLSDDGKGGDKAFCHELPEIFLWDSLNACVCLKNRHSYTALFKDGSTNAKVSTFHKYKIIGIQG